MTTNGHSYVYHSPGGGGSGNAPTRPDLDFDPNVLEFERYPIRQESVGREWYGSSAHEYGKAEVDKHNSDEDASWTSDDESLKWKDASSNLRDEIPWDHRYYPLPNTAAAQPVSEPPPNLEVDFSDVFDVQAPDTTSYTAQSHEGTSEKEMEPTEDTNAPGSILDAEFDEPAPLSNNTQEREEGNISRDDSKAVLQSVKDIHMTNPLSIVSEDGNILNSPASKHLISQFEKFLVKEIIIKRTSKSRLESQHSGGDILNSFTDTTTTTGNDASPSLHSVQMELSADPVGAGKPSVINPTSETFTVAGRRVGFTESLHSAPSATPPEDASIATSVKRSLNTTAPISSDGESSLGPADGDNNISFTAVANVEETSTTLFVQPTSGRNDIRSKSSTSLDEPQGGAQPLKKIIPETKLAESLLSVTKYELEMVEAAEPPSKQQQQLVTNEERELETPKLVSSGRFPCRYAFSGCKEMLERGTMYEQDHHYSCKYRPLPCLLAPACAEILPFHAYIPHLMHHFLVPTYSTEVTTPVILTPDDFNRSQIWTPKWFSAHKHHFFAMLSRREVSGGIWSAWTWILGSSAEADNFAVRITLFKGLKEVSNIFPVHSIRTKLDEIEEHRTCLLLNDQAINELTGIGSNILSDFSLKVQLIPNAKELNRTTRDLRALSLAKPPLRSEKLYVTTVDVRAEEDPTQASKF